MTNDRVVTSRPQTESLLSVLALLEDSGVPYCLLHRWSGFPVIGDSDVDIVVAERDRVRAEQVLIEKCPSLGYRVVQRLRHQATACYYVLLPLDPACAELALKIDICSSYRRDGRILFEPDLFLDGRSLEADFWVPCAAVECVCYLLKRIGKGSVECAGFTWMTARYRLNPTDATMLMGSFIGAAHAERVGTWLQNDDIDAFMESLPTLRRTFLSLTRFRDPGAVLAYWFAEVPRRFGRFLRPTGLQVAVLGPDGAGKSVLIDALRSSLGDVFRRVEYRHLRPGLFSGKRNSGAPVLNPHGQLPYGPLTSLLKLSYLWLDYTLGYAFRVQPLRVRSTLLLFDRYFYDIVVDPLRFRYGGPSSLAQCAARLSPSPDLVLVIDAPTAMVHGRKAEVPIEETERQRRGYHSLITRLPRAVLIDGSVCKDEVARQAVVAIADVLASRIRTRP